MTNAETAVRDAIEAAREEMDLWVPTGREASLVRTKLDEALMWALRGISGHD